MCKAVSQGRKILACFLRGKKFFQFRGWKVLSQRGVNMARDRKILPTFCNRSGKSVSTQLSRLYEKYLALRGKLVLFHLTCECGHIHGSEIVLKVTHISRTYPFNKNHIKLRGQFIAGTTTVLTTLITKNIRKYHILTRRDLPLLIGYKYTSSLLGEILKG